MEDNHFYHEALPVLYAYQTPTLGHSRALFNYVLNFLLGKNTHKKKNHVLLSIQIKPTTLSFYREYTPVQMP